MTAEFRFLHTRILHIETIKIYQFLSFQHLDIVSPFQLYFNPTLIVLHYQVWRLITTFLFFGTIGFNFLFNMTFTYRYCRMLEEGSFRGKSSDFIMMFIFGGTLMIVSCNIKKNCVLTKEKSTSNKPNMVINYNGLRLLSIQTNVDICVLY